MAGELDLGKVIGDPGPGVPAGGAVGKFLRKRSSADYDFDFANAVQTINGEQPDDNGNYNVIRTQFARQIETDSNQSSSGEYLYRTTGGDASISDGDATLVGIYGRRIHTGYVAEVLDMTVNAAAREEGQYAITAELNKDTFRLYVPSSRTVTLTYTSAWSENPTLYGVSVTGTPVSGDEIVIVYVKEERGTITHSIPEAFVSMGWNLYNNAVGYARVKKYSDTYGFLVGGNYTGLQYSETLDGAKTPITVAGSAFTVPGDGYVWVTGGDATTTYIMMTWSDWGSGPEGGFKAYTESVIDLSSILALMPYGCLAQVGGVADTIDFSVGVATSNVERLAYSGENMEMAAASGRPYEYDENYIYISRVTPLVYEFTLSSTFTANDHGMELISGSAVGVFVETIYGENLVDKLRTDIPNKLAAHDQQIANLQDGLAIVANGNTHAAIASGQFVYVKNHGTLAEGLYKATAAIGTNATLSTSNLTADGAGGLNALKNDVDALNSNLHPKDELSSVSEIVTLVQKPDNNGYSLFRVTDGLNNSLTGVSKSATVLAFKTSSVSNYIEYLSLDYDGDIRTGSYNVSTNTKSVFQASVHIGSLTGTTSSAGNISKTFDRNAVVLSAWSSSSGYVITPYASSGAGDSGQYTWWFHVCSDAADTHVIANTSVTVYYTFMFVNG